MNKADVIKLLTVLQANYPDSFRDMSDAAVNGRINLWFGIFREDAYSEVMAAVMAHIAGDTNRFMPPVGVIKSKLVELKSGVGALTELDAWRLVSKATRNGYYGAEKEFAKLPPLVQKAVGDPAMLKTWSQMAMDEVETVVQSNFMRSYRAKLKAEKDLLTLPADAKKVFERLSGGEEKSLAELLEAPEQK